MKFNKKGAGEIAVALLVAVSLVLVVLALYNFYHFKNEISSKFNKIVYMTNEADFAEDYIRAEFVLIARTSIRTGVPFSTTSVKYDMNYMGAGNFFSKFRNKDFDYYIANCSGTMKYILNMKGIEYTIRKFEDIGHNEQNENSWNRKFDICNVYNSRGDVLDRNCDVDKILSGCTYTKI